MHYYCIWRRLRLLYMKVLPSCLSDFGWLVICQSRRNTVQEMYEMNTVHTD